ncbi:efflux transporter outer membrane subunit [Dyella tabacisoli]|uniref:RND transporter n=1 Tax=Dyella tabacisoli TaxID=2282381 RepID=A0A369UTN6_9GAMM|nr:efflux transporter outer membrane subunit [Dyella tabacisoli]RDD83078.1 RND transporter [Dyella tabacisoli]
MIKTRLAAAMLLTFVLAGCAVGPDFRHPETPTPERFARKEKPADEKPADEKPSDSGSGTTTDSEFWQSFNDPQLTALIDQALAANNDLRLALSRYDSENALLREAKFDRYPTITANAQGGHRLVSKDQSYGFPRGSRFYSASANASWELDLFGRVRRHVEAQRAETAARASDLQAMQISIVGEVASTYVQLRGAQEQLRVARANADNQRETLHLVDTRLRAGRGTDFDTARARAQFEITASRVPALEAQIAVDEHRLAVLTARSPEVLIADLDAQKSLPTLPADIDPGTPSDLLRRRPDIVAAEQRLHASTARIGVATADLFPRLSLSGALGSQAFRSGDLFKSSSETSLLALGIDWSFLDIGRVRARIAASHADAAGLLAQYQQTVLLALEDTENALVRYARTRSEDEQLARAAADSAQAAQLARVRFEAGAIDLYEVLDAERTQLQAQDAYADSHTRTATAAVALYKALAGGWPQHIPKREGLATLASPLTQ